MPDLTIPPTEHVKVALTGRQCRALSFMFADIGSIMNRMPEMPQAVVLACRAIVTFATLNAERSGNGVSEYIISVPTFQAHLIAFAVAVYFVPRPMLDQAVMFEVIAAIDQAIMEKEKGPKQIGGKHEG